MQSNRGVSTRRQPRESNPISIWSVDCGPIQALQLDVEIVFARCPRIAIKDLYRRCRRSVLARARGYRTLQLNSAARSASDPAVGRDAEVLLHGDRVPARGRAATGRELQLEEKLSRAGVEDTGFFGSTSLEKEQPSLRDDPPTEH